MVDVRGDVLRPPHGTTPAVEYNMYEESLMKCHSLLYSKTGIFRGKHYPDPKHRLRAHARTASTRLF